MLGLQDHQRGRFILDGVCGAGLSFLRFLFAENLRPPSVLEAPRIEAAG